MSNKNRHGEWRPRGFFIKNTVKLSELSPGTLLEYRGEITTADDIRKMAINGSVEASVYTVTDNCITSILNNAYSNYKDGTVTNYVSARNYGRRVLIDH